METKINDDTVRGKLGRKERKKTLTTFFFIICTVNRYNIIRLEGPCMRLKQKQYNRSPLITEINHSKNYEKIAHQSPKFYEKDDFQSVTISKTLLIALQ